MNDLVFTLSALILGGLHALEPGHGKTVVAAYLVGSRGRVRDAIALGGIVTFTHTFSIILLGLLTSIAATYFVPETVHEVLEVVSGLLIVGVGFWMIYNRIILGQAAHGHSHGSDHDHHHDHAADAQAVAHDHPHGVHAHEQEHGQAHSDGDHGHSHAPTSGTKPGIGSLVTLGISGGIVPCPAALALLLAAVAAGNILAGVSLVVVFSLGLAAVLIAIGIVLVKASHIAGRYLGDKTDSDSAFARFAGAASAIVVTMLGLVMTLRAIFEVTGMGPLF